MMKKIWEWILSLFGAGKKAPDWKDCKLSSNWNGSNAQERMMNILSPNMSDAKFNQRVAFMKSRGVNTVHVFTANKRDGECAGYSPFGPNFLTYAVDKNFSGVMTKRLKALRKKGWAVVLWLMADDSNDWAKDVASSAAKADKYVKAIRDLGWFDMASTVVIGLEMNEYWSVGQANVMAGAVRKYWKGKVGVHHTSGSAAFVGLGDILFYQIEPQKDVNNTAPVVAATKKALSYGKPVNMFEMQRNPNRKFCEAAIAAGAFAVGNW